MKILITGSTGNVGFEIIKNLARVDNVEVLAAVSKLGNLKFEAANIKQVAFSFTNPSTWGVFEGVERVFLMRPPQISNIKRDMQPAIEAAIEKGVKHFVFLSLIGVENNKVVPHYKIEKLLLEKKVAYTFLRCGFFMQNLTTTHLQDIKEDSCLVLPAGKGLTSFIDIRDIAEIGARALYEQGHEFKAYDLTGIEALSYYQIADILTDVLGRKISYCDASVFKFWLHMGKRGHKAAFRMVVTVLYLVTKFGKAGYIAPETPQILGHAPISFKQFAIDNKHIWM